MTKQKIKITQPKPAIGGGKPKLNSVKIGEQRPVFESLFGAFPAEPTPNPLDAIEIEGTPEERADAEVEAARQHFFDEKHKRRDQYRTQLDHEFWVAICFQNRAQKEKFLSLLGLTDLGDKYIDGLKVAERLNVPIEPENLQIKDLRPAPKLLRDDALIL